ncbi:DUF6916 family protein [Brevifollis gellanilyticus]|uniref:DUF6916 domain-containing protein n=1 Tax=Brevifollis gellanilyticus TaxID=748831 RepID=A0A512M7D5_9BACT|nr:hypothetical protein [Brevifollis gellanilyticus]GEP42652.1 hypothetical protein BGE01nite_19430 [Brevifollis gellanilyticus]
MILAGLGVGLGGTLAGVLGWQWAKGRTFFAKAPLSSRHTSPVAPAEDLDPAKPAHYIREWFEPHLNTHFQLKVGALTAATMKLTEISPAKVVNNHDKLVSYTTFSLTFTGPKSLPEDSQIYRVEHPELGAMDLFLTSVGRYPTERHLEAIFTQRI